MTVALAAQAACFEQDGIKARPAAVPSRGSAEMATWWIELAPGAVSMPHAIDCEEVFLVTAGELSATIDGETFSAGAGDALIVRPDALFHIANHGPEVVRAACVTRAGMQASVGGQLIVPPWSK